MWFWPYHKRTLVKRKKRGGLLVWHVSGGLETRFELTWPKQREPWVMRGQQKPVEPARMNVNFSLHFLHPHPLAASQVIGRFGGQMSPMQNGSEASWQQLSNWNYTDASLQRIGTSPFPARGMMYDPLTSESSYPPHRNQASPSEAIG